MTETEEKLNPKQKKFADFYLGEALFNATKAYRLAGYSGDDNALSAGASRLLRNVKVSAYIEEQLATQGMGANEVITRLAEIARGDIDDVQNADGYFDIHLARKRNKTGLLKKFKCKRTIKQKKTEIVDNMRTFLAEDEIEDIESETEIIYEEVEYEMYSKHEALRDLGKFHKLFTDKVEHGGSVEMSHKKAINLSKLSAEELEAFEQLLEKTNG